MKIYPTPISSGTQDGQNGATPDLHIIIPDVDEVQDSQPRFSVGGPYHTPWFMITMITLQVLAFGMIANPKESSLAYVPQR